VRILPVENEHNAPRLQRGEHSNKDPAVLRDQDRHPVAYPPAPIDDAMGKTVGRLVEVRITDFAEAAVHGDPVGIRPAVRSKHLGKQAPNAVYRSASALSSPHAVL
jgi:hypothetical protein